MNQLAFPGLGTILMGSKIGYAQATIMVAGFILTTGFLLWLIACTLRAFFHPGWSQEDLAAQYRPYFWALYWGLGLTAVAWFWALASSIAFLRRKPDGPKS